jgi:hypothetical protein
MSHEQLLPGALVRVAAPEAEHLAYQNDQGRIVDVREFGDHRYCQVNLQRSQDLIFFASTELELISRESEQA